jgi:hypothetical protein
MALRNIRDYSRTTVFHFLRGNMISVDINVTNIPDLKAEQIRPAITLTLTQVASKVQNRAKENAPYDTGALRSSIITDYTMMYTGKVEVGSNLVYARRREYENFKNPNRRLYLTRARDEVEPAVRDLFISNIT